MDRMIFQQLVDLAESFNRIGLKPVICGGLGIYLCFHKSTGSPGDSLRSDRQMIRATNDIDLMLTRTQVHEQAQRRAIAEIITEGLGYVVREGCEHFQFKKNPEQSLDILSPPVDGLKVENYRVKIVKSKLHGHITPEACFIEEALRMVPLAKFLPDNESGTGCDVCVPSPTNLMLLKLFAFNDRDAGKRENSERALAHTWDIYILIMLTSRDDYIEGREFLSRHEDSDIVRTARSIVSNKFSSVTQSGWRRILESSGFYPEFNRQQKETRLDEARRRLLRWFDIRQ